MLLFARAAASVYILFGKPQNLFRVLRFCLLSANASRVQQLICGIAVTPKAGPPNV
jgi:hypothetical protein